MASEIFLVCTTLQHHNSKGNSSKTQTLQLLNHQTLKPSNPPTLKLSHHNPFKPFWSLALWRASHAANHLSQLLVIAPDTRPRHCRWSGTPGEIKGQVWDLAICNHCNAQLLWMSIAMHSYCECLSQNVPLMSHRSPRRRAAFQCECDAWTRPSWASSIGSGRPRQLDCASWGFKIWECFEVWG